MTPRRKMFANPVDFARQSPHSTAPVARTGCALVLQEVQKLGLQKYWKPWADDVTAPKHFIKIPFQNKADEWAFLYATNTCYHVKHHLSFNSLEWE